MKTAMKASFRFRLLLAGMSLFLLLTVSGIQILAQAASGTTPTPFQVIGDMPVIPHSGSTKNWDGVYTDPGAVIYHDGMFHMFRNGFNGWPASVQIGYATSVDGVSWSSSDANPVLRTDDVPYAGVAALASDALVLDDGTWVLYFYTWESYSGVTSRGAIGRATAPTPTGPWTVDPEPVLQPGSEAAWDGNQVSAPRVVKNEDGYFMYYSGNQTGLTSSMIGLATSPDGIVWTRYDDPATTDAPFAESDPILRSDDPAVFFHQPMVQQTPDGWVMLYRAVKRPNMWLNRAVSDDGIHWMTPSTDPVFGRDQLPKKQQFWYTAFVYYDDTAYLFVEGADGSGSSIFTATHAGSLIP